MKRFELRKDARQQWRAYFYAANGECQWVTSESYHNESECREAVTSVKGSKSAKVALAVKPAARRR